MASFVDVTGFRGVLVSLAPFGGLPFAGTLPLVSKATNTSMKGELSFALCAITDRPVFLAAKNGHEAAVSALLVAGADKNAVNEKGATPLLIAVKNGHEKCVQLLLGAGAVVDQARNGGFKPLYIAAENGHKKCVQLLLGAGAVVAQAKRRWRRVETRRDALGR